MPLTEVLNQSPVLLTGFCFLLGLLVGSFLNVVIYRLPVMMERTWKQEARDILELPAPPADDSGEAFNLVVPRSRCPKCGHNITWYENVPLVSWLLLRGKCSECGIRIPARYPLVELMTGVLSAAVAWQLGFGPWLGGALLLTWCLVALSMIDFDTTLLPDSITLPLLWAGILMALLNLGPVSLADSVTGAVAGYLSLWSVYWLFKLLTGKEGMGFGDFKLLGALGAWLGWQMLPLVILLSSVVGALVGSSLIALKGQDQAQPIPFGPYLAIAGWIALLWGDTILTAYLGLFRF